MRVTNLLLAINTAYALDRVITNVQPPDYFDDFPEIEIVGSKFFNSLTGEQFFMKGIAYQPQRSMWDLEHATGAFETDYIDPLATPDICFRDIPYLKKLGINTIRVYSIDPKQNHDECMFALMDAGIYTILDLSEPATSIVREAPVWDVTLFQRYADVVDAMQKYPNVLGFFAGNEVANDISTTSSVPFIKAAIRDIKKYIGSQGYREIPVGYSTNDDAMTRDQLADYFVCGEDTVDFYGINMYEWCGYSNYEMSGYKECTENFRDYPVPVFFSEFGCNLVRPRPFTEIEALFSEKMTDVWSGGLAFMYFEEDNGYGVVQLDPETNTVTELPDFYLLQEQYQAADPIGVTREDYENAYLLLKRWESSCPELSETWMGNEALPPTPDSHRCSCLESVLPCLTTPFENKIRYNEFFDYVCTQVDCSDIQGDGKLGKYGSFSACSANQKLSLEISKLYFKSGSMEAVCPIADSNINFNKQFSRSTKKSRGDDGCASVLNEVREEFFPTKPKIRNVAAVAESMVVAGPTAAETTEYMQTTTTSLGSSSYSVQELPNICDIQFRMRGFGLLYISTLIACVFL